MANLRDIADELSVSPSLVSKVLSGRMGTSGVSPETLELIRSKAQQMGYHPNRTAAALATGKQNSFGVFLHGVGARGSGIMESLLQGIADEATRRGQRLILRFFETSEQFLSFSTEIHANVMDGMIIGGIAHHDLRDRLLQVQDQDVPIVSIFDQPIDNRFVNVGNDQERVGRIATEHLISRGCKRIATVSFQAARLRGYLAALQEQGLCSDPQLIYTGDSWGAETAERAVQHFARSGIQYDGLMAQCDAHAIGAFNQLVRMGKRIPQDVKLIGIDNSSFCDLNIVPISSVSQQEHFRGQRAVQLLLDQISGSKVKSVQIEPVLHARESSR